MTIETIDTVLYTTIFLLPGYIINSIIAALIPKEKEDDSNYFISCLLYSLINCSMWSWVYKLAMKFLQPNTIIYWIILLLITILGAILIALTIGIIKQQHLVEKMFDKIKIRKKDPIPNAWDYVFSKQESHWMIVTLKSGNIIYGLFSSNSFASSDSNERDLFVERTYTVDKNNNWIECERNKGALISWEDIEVIEFFI